LTTPGAPLLYYGDEYGEYGGADPDNRHMYRNESSWSTVETQLFENISELGKLRSESIALQRGEYSTRLAMTNLLVYNMTHDDQVMSIVLNRGAPTTVDGFESNDVVRFGESAMLDGTLSVEAHSVTVIELDADVVPPPVYGCTDLTATNFDAEATQDDGNCQYETDPVDQCANVFCDACPDGWITLPAEEGECCPSCQEPSENNQTDTANQTSSDNETQLPDSTNETNGNQSVSDEMKTCEGCCGDTFEVTIDELCPTPACSACEDSEGSESKSSAIELTQSLLIGGIILAVIVLVFTRKRSSFQDEKAFDFESNDQEN